MAAPTPFQRKLATIAQDQYEKYHLIREAQEPLASQIEDYWKDLGFDFPGVGEAWSAVFVSWCLKQAGATKSQFRFAAMHSEFVRQAIKNASNGNGSGAFLGRPVDQYAPKIGDILQNNRAGNHFDFAYARSHSSYKSHSAIVMEVGSDNKGNYLRTIGGNESDSVGLKEVRLTSSGLVRNPDGLYISVIETTL
ncbi:MAG TPA: DUF2272 domain-containing protein [Candidatus Binatia bacterium]|nr:DUF2272 domain-containing protein [Candidatus Binatia bacterium]